MIPYEQIQKQLRKNPKVWLITGVAGFIGSNLLEFLLKLDQKVVGLDNFVTGFQYNLDEVKSIVSYKQWSQFRFISGDICSLSDCHRVCSGVDYVLHQAALGSVPRSLSDPIGTNAANINGFLNILVAARDAKVKSFTYAASSSTYGDHRVLPKKEDIIGKPLSPYAVTKYVNELYADVFGRSYGFNTIGLRYFNVFGPRQDPNGAYAAVIPKWTAALLSGEKVFINGDGTTSRDFCYVANVIQANLLAATVDHEAAICQVYNIAVGDSTSLNELFNHLRDNLSFQFPSLKDTKPHYQDFRPGDVRHSLADIQKAAGLLAYNPAYGLVEGLKEALPWYIRWFKHSYEQL